MPGARWGIYPGKLTILSRFYLATLSLKYRCHIQNGRTASRKSLSPNDVCFCFIHFPYEDYMKLVSTANVKQFENSNELGKAQFNLTQIKEAMLVCGSWSVWLVVVITTTLLLTLATQVHAAEVVTPCCTHSVVGTMAHFLTPASLPMPQATCTALRKLLALTDSATCSNFHRSPAAVGAFP